MPGSAGCGGACEREVASTRPHSTQRMRKHGAQPACCLHAPPPRWLRRHLRFVLQPMPLAVTVVIRLLLPSPG